MWKLMPVPAVREKRSGWKLLLTLVVLLTAGCVAPSETLDAGTDDMDGENPSSFAAAVVVDHDVRRGFEPSVVMLPSGDLLMCSPRGYPSGTEVYRSKDAGSTWEPLHILRLPPRGAPLRSGTGDVGGGDCSMTVDAGGRAYVADAYSGSASVVSTADGGDTWRGVPMSIPCPRVDRPWAAGGEADEVFVTGACPQMADDWESIPGEQLIHRGGIFVSRSTDGGFTFPETTLLVDNQEKIGHNGNIAYADGVVGLLYGKKLDEGRLALVLARSEDHGATWEHVTVAEQPFKPGTCFSPFDIFPIVTAHVEHGWHAAWVLQDPRTERLELFVSSSRDGGLTWSTPHALMDRTGGRHDPWIAVAPDGRVGVTWWETNVSIGLDELSNPDDLVERGCYRPHGEERPILYHVHYAETVNPFAEEPVWREALVQEEPLHDGGHYRPYAEVMSLVYLQDGRALAAFVGDVEDDVTRNLVAVQRR